MNGTYYAGTGISLRRHHYIQLKNGAYGLYKGTLDSYHDNWKTKTPPPAHRPVMLAEILYNYQLKL